MSDKTLHTLCDMIKLVIENSKLKLTNDGYNVLQRLTLCHVVDSRLEQQTKYTALVWR